MTRREDTLIMRHRLERVALVADVAGHYVQDMRVMPARGVARVAWDAMDYIAELERQLADAQDEARVMAEKLDAAEIKLRDKAGGTA